MSKARPHAGRAFLDSEVYFSWGELAKTPFVVHTVILYLLISGLHEGEGVLHTARLCCADHAIPQHRDACSAFGNTASVD